MATPVYNDARGYGRRQYRRGRSYRRRTWGVFTRTGSMLRGGTPQYLGAGQPAASGGGSLFGDDTPDYLACPSLATATQSVTPSDATTTQAAPQDGQLAIVVPRS
jgi:hypothetical protein